MTLKLQRSVWYRRVGIVQSIRVNRLQDHHRNWQIFFLNACRLGGKRHTWEKLSSPPGFRSEGPLRNALRHDNLLWVWALRSFLNLEKFWGFIVSSCVLLLLCVCRKTYLSSLGITAVAISVWWSQKWPEGGAGEDTQILAACQSQGSPEGIPALIMYLTLNWTVIY